MDRPTDLFEEDFYLWTQSQAEALRAAGRSGARSNAIEWDRLAEEVEDLGRRERQACESYCVLIIERLAKLSVVEVEEPKRHWRREIRISRVNLRRRLSPSIRAQLERDLAALHADAGEVLCDSLPDGVDLAAAQALRLTLPQLFGEADDPLAR